MILETFHNFPDFELLDSGNGYRLERWGGAFLKRPDPQAIWQPSFPEKWKNIHAIFKSGTDDERGSWEIRTHLPSPWVVTFNNVAFSLKLSPFKHTGLFAEQAAQWEWMINKISNSQQPIPNSKIKILNLFAYTGGATMVLAKAGCFVTHVDASKPAIAWAKDNHALNRLPPDSVRWILDDAVKFVQRELRRGISYDGVIMDPPAFGHGPSGKTWKFNRDLPKLLADSIKLLSGKAAFLLVNGYATNSSALALGNVLEDALGRRQGNLEFGELCLKQSNHRLLSTGIFARWSQ